MKKIERTHTKCEQAKVGIYMTMLGDGNVIDSNQLTTHQLVDSSIMQRNVYFWQAIKVSTENAKQISRANSDTVKAREFMPEHWAVHPNCSKLCLLHLQKANSNPSVVHDTKDGGHRETRINGEEKRFQFKPGGVGSILDQIKKS